MLTEIRTPLVGVMGSVQLLQATNLTPEQNEFVNIFHICIQQLSTIINDILDFTKIDEDKVVKIKFLENS
jgi:signal transduction histidine kinase